MNYQPNTKKTLNNLTEILTANIYKHIGLADDKECPNCGEEIPLNYAWENIITKKIISACNDCAAPFIVKNQEAK